VPAEQVNKKIEDDVSVRVVSSIKAAHATMRSKPASGALSVACRTF
jgi:methylmalonyl-CoA mutase cobalamin-binding subunit